MPELVPRAIMQAIPISTLFPVTLGLGMVAIAAFGSAWAIAAVRIRPRTRVYGLLACGLLLAACSAYYILTGPSAAELTIVHTSRVRNPYFDLYRAVWVANIVISLLLLVLVPALGIRLRRGKAPQTAEPTRRARGARSHVRGARSNSNIPDTTGIRQSQ